MAFSSRASPSELSRCLDWPAQIGVVAKTAELTASSEFFKVLDEAKEAQVSELQLICGSVSCRLFFRCDSELILKVEWDPAYGAAMARSICAGAATSSGREPPVRAQPGDACLDFSAGPKLAARLVPAATQVGFTLVLSISDFEHHQQPKASWLVQVKGRIFD